LLSRQRTRHALQRITRYLEPCVWQEIKDFIATTPKETHRETAHAYRVRWLFALLYLGGLHIAEAGANTMTKFFVRRDADGNLRWWLAVQGKGDKQRLVCRPRAR
jgi:integrase/recombinase XerD